MRICDALRRAAARLENSDANNDAPGLAAKLLMQHVLGVDAAGLIARDRDELVPQQIQRFLHLVDLACSIPVYRVIGSRPFYGLELQMNAATLEPRDDTETLVDVVLSRLKQRDPDLTGSWRFADLGTGTGAVALALLSQLPNAAAILTDISEDALAAARKNSEQLGDGKIEGQSRCLFLKGDWVSPLSGLDEKLDFIVSNPPYIATRQIDSLERTVRDVDPMAALDGGEDGLDAYRSILRGASNVLKTGGFLAFEMGYDQGMALASLGRSLGWSPLAIYRDLGSRERVILFEGCELKTAG